MSQQHFGVEPNNPEAHLLFLKNILRAEIRNTELNILWSWRVSTKRGSAASLLLVALLMLT